MMITCEDWRQAPAAVVGKLFDAECGRWEHGLSWNYRPACRLLELARQNGHLPGLLARARYGRISGWAYFLLHEDTLQIGNLVAEDGATMSALLDGILCAPEAGPARRARSFLYPVRPGIEDALAERGFAIERHVYMQRVLEGGPANRASAGPALRPAALSDVRNAGRVAPCACVIDRWSSKVIPPVVQLLARAYEGMRQARCFAPDGRLDQWTNYVGQLLQTPACGRFEQRLSIVARTGGGLLAGCVLVTALADRTAHIAQMAVAPGQRGRGLGEQLVRAVCERAADAGFDRMTLLVAESNACARRLYARTRFEARASFLFADRENRQ